MPKPKLPSKQATQILEQVIPKRPEGTRGISYSQYSVFKECPLRWDLTYRQGNYMPTPSIHTTFGTAIHACIQEWLTLLYTSTIKASEGYDFESNLERYMIETYKKEKENNNNTHYSNEKELQEFFEDGVAILKYLRRNRSKIFDVKWQELVAHELQLNTPVFLENLNIYFNAFLDTVFLVKILGNSADDIRYTVLVLDWKSSTKGWGDWDLKSDKKLNQVRLYKHYFAQQFGWPMESIDVEFKVLKRKVNTFQLDSGYDMETPRLQTVIPTQGKSKIKAAVDDLQSFVKTCYNEDGTHAEGYYQANPGNACKFCPFRNTEMCENWM